MDSNKDLNINTTESAGIIKKERSPAQIAHSEKMKAEAAARKATKATETKVEIKTADQVIAKEPVLTPAQAASKAKEIKDAQEYAANLKAIADYDKGKGSVSTLDKQIAKVEKNLQRQLNAEKKISCTLPLLGGGARQEETVTLNGHNFLLMRGVPLELPQSIYDVISRTDKIKMQNVIESNRLQEQAFAQARGAAFMAPPI